MQQDCAKRKIDWRLLERAERLGREAAVYESLELRLTYLLAAQAAPSGGEFQKADQNLRAFVARYSTADP